MEKQGSGSVYGNVVDKHSAIDMSPNNGMEEEEWRARAYICERYVVGTVYGYESVSFCCIICTDR